MRSLVKRVSSELDEGIDADPCNLDTKPLLISWLLHYLCRGRHVRGDAMPHFLWASGKRTELRAWRHEHFGAAWIKQQARTLYGHAQANIDQFSLTVITPNQMASLTCLRKIGSVDHDLRGSTCSTPDNISHERDQALCVGFLMSMRATVCFVDNGYLHLL